MRLRTTVKILVLIGFVSCAWLMAGAIRGNIDKMVRRYNAATNPAPSVQRAVQVSADSPAPAGFTIPPEMMPRGDVYFVTIIKGHGENDGIWVLDRPPKTASEKAGFLLIMEAAKRGDARHYPLPNELKDDKQQ